MSKEAMPTCDNLDKPRRLNAPPEPFDKHSPGHDDYLLDRICIFPAPGNLKDERENEPIEMFDLDLQKATGVRPNRTKQTSLKQKIKRWIIALF